MDRVELTRKIKEWAAELGFSLCGICPAIAPPGAARLSEWLAAGYAGQMHYLADRREAYADPNRVLDGVRSIVMVAMNYQTAVPAKPGAGQGRISRYAWGDADYHDLIRQRLNQLATQIVELSPDAQVRGVVDTAPLLEREFAQLAGLGWIGKNTLLLHRDAGSWFFLGAMLIDIELDYDAPHHSNHCGTCRACLDACPTDAFPQPYLLDASRCISYLTIELRDAIPEELRSGIGDWIFGCDVCQDVCPWNSRAPLTTFAAFEPRTDSNPMELIALFSLSDEAFRDRFRGTPLWRPRRRGILRNAAIVLGNRPTNAAVPALIRGLNDPEPLVRGACAWALGREGQSAAVAALRERRSIETERDVLHEIDTSLKRCVIVPPVDHAKGVAAQ
jgi:epoxyqueuosine reductase